MKAKRQLDSSWRYAVTCFLAVFCCTVSEGAERAKRRFTLHNDGLLSFSNTSASMRGTGKSVMLFDDFELSVDGQMQMTGSTRLVREPGKDQSRHFRTEPVWVSIVATGKVLLKFQTSGETFSCRIAVYRVGERAWILDGVPLNPCDR